jgi:hypothetical protein
VGRRAVEIDEAAVVVLARQVRTSDVEVVGENRIVLREGASFVPPRASGKVRCDKRMGCCGVGRLCPMASRCVV